MRPTSTMLHAASRGLAALATAALLACAAGAGDAAAGAAIPLSRVATPAPAEALQRAVTAVRRGDTRHAVEVLESLGLAEGARFPDSDRAAFLLAQSYLRLGSLERFEQLAAAVEQWPDITPYTHWIAYRRLLLAAEHGAADPHEVAGQTLPPAAANAFGVLADTSVTADAALERLAIADTVSAAGRELAAAARLRLATRRLERGEDAAAQLAAVPSGTRLSARAAHMLGLAWLERGNAAEGRRVLSALAAADSDYAGRREVLLALAGAAMDGAEWPAALEHYRHADRDWHARREELDAALAAGSFDGLWQSWQGGAPLAGALTLDANPFGRAANALEQQALDLTRRDSAAPPELSVARGATPLVPPPTPAEWDAYVRASREAAASEAERERAGWDVARETESLADIRRYLGEGGERVTREQQSLAARSAELDSLRGQVDAIAARLHAVHEAMRLRIAERTRQLLERCAKNELWMSAMRQLHADGPERGAAAWSPPGYPSPTALLLNEEALGRALRALTERTAAESPGLLARSHEDAWGPRLIDKAFQLSGEASDALAWAKRLGIAIDSSVAAAQSSEALRDALAAAAAADHRADSLSRAHVALRDRLARAAIERARDTMDPEREPIDYGLAAAAYATAVRLGDADTVAIADSAGTAIDDPGTLRARAEAMAEMRRFLATHPASGARGEMRFRLADLELAEAQYAFRAKMAHFLEEQAAGRAAGALPVVDHAPAYALYRAILVEDSTFAHRDAVLFNAGMILADDGDPGAEKHFADLVRDWPASPYVQEANLRLGDMRFADQRFAESIALYERAAQGPDAGQKAIALYKMGWAHFNEEQFTDAADAFRRVLDLYAGGEKVELKVDLQKESETYFIQSMARAGGAGAFAAYFQKTGDRPYEKQLLKSLGQHFRRYSLFGEAAAADQLFLERYPLDADALLSAQRLVETHQRADHRPEARAAQLANAPRFAPGSPWANAQTSDSLRAAGAAFARGAYAAVAHDLHLEARRTGSPDTWRAALAQYETLLRQWPDDAETPAFELQAGEANTQLGDYAAALAHYQHAAEQGRDSVVTQALWQRVAVTDTWYESTRAADAKGQSGLGRDSLAYQVLMRADELLAHDPEHAHAADLLWRQGNLALAHGWSERAVTAFGTLATRHPNDIRTPQAAMLKADALFQAGRFGDAGAGYDSALVAARRAHADSLVRRAEQALPVAAFRNAEAALGPDSSHVQQHAELLEALAERYPQYEHSPLALYRAALAWQSAGDRRAAVRALGTLIRAYPRGAYERDAHLQIAAIEESAGHREAAGDAWVRFAERFPQDSSAAPAWLKAADLYASAGLDARADTLRLGYLRLYPKDVEGAMEILADFSARELQSVTATRPISTLLPPPPAKRTRVAPPPASRLAQYMAMAAAHPALASRPLLAQVRFLEGEESFAHFRAMRITQPLTKSIPAKQKLMDATLAHYRQAVDLGVPQWSYGATHQIGQVLASFAEALEASERPADLHGDDLRAYEDVLFRQAQPFHDRAEQVWTDLLRTKGREAPDDPWIQKSRTALYDRLAKRFYFRPEPELPLISARTPDRIEPEPPADSSGAKGQKQSKKQQHRDTVSDEGSTP